MIDWIIGLSLGITLGTCIVALIEYLIDNPVFILKMILRDFKIALFTELNDNESINKQVYTIVGVTWFNIIISYQLTPRILESKYKYQEVFTVSKKRWINNGSPGYEKYETAKTILEDIKKRYFKKKTYWIGGILNEDGL